MDEFFVMKICPLKGQVYNLPSFCIINYLTPLFLSPHQRHYYFRFGIDEILGI